MRVFNQDKTVELFFYDLDNGFLQQDKLFVAHHPQVDEVKEVSHAVVVAEYPNGGKEIETVIDVPYQPHQDAYDEYEDILVYSPFTEEMTKEKRVSEIKERLSQLSEDFVQSWAGAYFPDIDARKKEFAQLHNELRVLFGKTPRTYF